jgi:hypothetical protein
MSLHTMGRESILELFPKVKFIALYKMTPCILLDMPTTLLPVDTFLANAHTAIGEKKGNTLH